VEYREWVLTAGEKCDRFTKKKSEQNGEKRDEEREMCRSST